MSEMNPYEPVRTSVPTPGDSAGGFSAAARSVEGGRGWSWIAAGWDLFKAQPGMWILLMIVYLVFVILVSLVPFLGPLINMLIYPVIAAGMMIGCRAVENGQPLEVAHLFAGFRQNTSNLLMLGLLTIVGWIVILVPVMLVMGGSALLTGMSSPAALGAAGSSFLIAVLLIIALSVPLYMALWFAPALVVFHALTPTDALKTSFFACLRNIVPFLLYGVILVFFSIAATIPAALGWLVLGPVIIASIYMGYRDIFYNA